MMVRIDRDKICGLFGRQLAYVNSAIILGQRCHLLAINDITQVSILNMRCSYLVHRYFDVQLLNLEDSADLYTLGNFLERDIE